MLAAFASFYDDVRIESNGKLLFIGGYQDTISLPAYPWQQALWVDVVIQAPLEEYTSLSEKFFLCLEYPGQEVVKIALRYRHATMDVEEEKRKGARLWTLRVRRQFDFKFTQSGHLRIFIEQEDGSIIPAGGLTIQSDIDQVETTLNPEQLAALVYHFTHRMNVTDPKIKKKVDQKALEVMKEFIAGKVMSVQNNPKSPFTIQKSPTSIQVLMTEPEVEARDFALAIDNRIIAKARTKKGEIDFPVELPQPFPPVVLEQATLHFGRALEKKTKEEKKPKRGGRGKINI